MKKISIVLLLCLFLCGCASWKWPQKLTKMWSQTTGLSVSHDPSVLSPPEAHLSQKNEKVPVPAGSEVVRTEVDATATTPASVTTVIKLPKDKGMDLLRSDTKTDLVGSKGFEPEKGATPVEKATAAWVYVGIGICALGVFFCTPWGGSNYRAGALIAAGGIGMSVIGKFIDQISIPAPAMGLIFVAIALAVYYGYRVRHKQLETQPTQ